MVGREDYERHVNVTESIWPNHSRIAFRYCHPGIMLFMAYPRFSPACCTLGVSHSSGVFRSLPSREPKKYLSTSRLPLSLHARALLRGRPAGDIGPFPAAYAVRETTFIESPRVVWAMFIK